MGRYISVSWGSRKNWTCFKCWTTVSSTFKWC